jgi:hypothetical protein
LQSIGFIELNSFWCLEKQHCGAASKLCFSDSEKENDVAVNQLKLRQKRKLFTAPSGPGSGSVTIEKLLMWKTLIQVMLLHGVQFIVF